MKITEAPVRHEFENILPLINVVFLLLIFFMLAGSFSRPDFYEVSAPVAENDKAADRKELTLLMNAEGRIAIDNAPYTDEELERFIEGRTSGEQQPRVQLKADAQVPSGRLLEIMELLGASGLESVRLLTQTPEQAGGTD